MVYQKSSNKHEGTNRSEGWQLVFCQMSSKGRKRITPSSSKDHLPADSPETNEKDGVSTETISSVLSAAGPVDASLLGFNASRSVRALVSFPPPPTTPHPHHHPTRDVAAKRQTRRFHSSAVYKTNDQLLLIFRMVIICGCCAV